MNRKLLTAEGYQRLQDELNDLVRKERPEITKIVSWAASLGDRSENADYLYNKRKLREIDRRVRYLIKLFEVAYKVEYSSEQDGKAYFGAWVELENNEGETIKFRIVGDEEIYGRKDYISLQSPIARACLGKSVGDEVKVQTPKGINEWYIIKIEYLDDNPPKNNRI
ncbi:transcription elongation factor GreB [Acinetobacter haemolyticus]|uniref:transcription elongation factor GreB n=1 Tax=Acinetobacter haemolyticus TaxID=29430 RepID=UPI000F74B1FB|nr:transcription elongation factor GreB [Acinetobacter haemolyticus]MCU4387338.1 transcription elongation factor GreB [Acinetobacter haemolyticus]RSN74757.1 transcription elongation factor GreB [Acinetobacter haemolyticus]